MKKSDKRKVVSYLHEKFKDPGSFIVIRNEGLNVSQMNDFRLKIRSSGGYLKFVKNRLAKIALQGTELESISFLLSGQSLIAYSPDPLMATKISVDFAKLYEKIVILGGVMEKQNLSPDEIISLASLPSFGALRARIIGMFMNPASRIASMLITPSNNLVRIFDQYSKKKE